MRLWYLRRAVHWPAVLGCCVAALCTVAAVHRWPDVGAPALPFALAGCAAAAGFLLDEVATAVVAVTPRAERWRTGSRYAIALLPFGWWSGLVVWLPEAARGSASGWLLAGVAGCLLALGLAATGAGAGVSRPGAGVATGLTLLTAGWVAVGPVVGLPSPYPFPVAGQGRAWAWSAVGVLGVVLLARAWWSTAPWARSASPRPAERAESRKRTLM